MRVGQGGVSEGFERGGGEGPLGNLEKGEGRR